MRSFLIAASFAALAVTPALAAGDDPMANFYGNTIVTTGGMAEIHSNYNADHTFTMSAPSYHMSFKGTWKLDGANVCRTFETAPPGTPNPLCTPLESHNVGDTWTATKDGQTRTLTL